MWTWLEWAQEQRICNRVYEQYPDSRFHTWSQHSDADLLASLTVHAKFEGVVEFVPFALHKYLERVVAVSISGDGPVDSASIEKLSRLNYLEEVSIKGGMDGDALKHFESSPSFRALSVIGGDVDDDDLALLDGHTNLVVLILADTKITDKSLKMLSDLLSAGGC